MIRKTVVMTLKHGCELEYQKRHDELWPQMERLIKDHGAHNYSIFLEQKTLKLFAYVEVESEALWQQISKHEVCQEWWAHMADIMDTNEDLSPCTTTLKAVFYLK